MRCSFSPERNPAAKAVLSQSVPYAALILCFTKIESTTKRLEILAYLTQFLVLVAKRAAPVADQGGGQEVLKVVYLCLNRVSPFFLLCLFPEPTYSP